MSIDHTWRTRTCSSDENGRITFSDHKVVSAEDWLQACVAILAKKDDERFATRSAGFGANCRGVEVGNAYVFDAPHGEVTLAYLSDGRGQLDIKQFCWARPDWAMRRVFLRGRSR